MPYQPGDTIRLSTTFKVGTVLTDPATVTLVVRAPDGTSATYTYAGSQVTRDSAGTFHRDYVAASSGTYAWKWTGTGTAAGIDEGTFTVEQTLAGALTLCSVDDVKTTLEITNTDSDELIQTLCLSSAAALNQRAQREFVGPSATSRDFGVRDLLLDLAPYDLRSASSVVIHPEESGPTLTADSDYLLLPMGGAPLGDTYQQVRFSARINLSSTLRREFGEARVRITGDWGIFGSAPVAEDIRRAAVLTVCSWMDRAIADYGALVEDGREIRPDFASSWAIPAPAWSLIMPWARLGTP